MLNHYEQAALSESDHWNPFSEAYLAAILLLLLLLLLLPALRRARRTLDRLAA